MFTVSMMYLEYPYTIHLHLWIPKVYQAPGLVRCVTAFALSIYYDLGVNSKPSSVKYKPEISMVLASFLRPTHDG